MPFKVFVWMVCVLLTLSVQGAIVNFYNELYLEDHIGRLLLEGLSCVSISDDDTCDLLKEFLEEKVWKAINGSW